MGISLGPSCYLLPIRPHWRYQGCGTWVVTWRSTHIGALRRHLLLATYAWWCGGLCTDLSYVSKIRSSNACRQVTLAYPWRASPRTLSQLCPSLKGAVLSWWQWTASQKMGLSYQHQRIVLLSKSPSSFLSISWNIGACQKALLVIEIQGSRPSFGRSYSNSLGLDYTSLQAFTWWANGEGECLARALSIGTFQQDWAKLMDIGQFSFNLQRSEATDKSIRFSHGANPRLHKELHHATREVAPLHIIC